MISMHAKPSASVRGICSTVYWAPLPAATVRYSVPEATKPSNASDAKANRFKPVVKFIGPFALGKGKTQTHRIALPMYVGSVRTMIVAGQDGAYGNAEKTTPVRTPLMLLSTLPRVLSTNEEILVPVNVFAMENQVKEVSVSLTTTGKAQIVGEARKTVRFAKTGDQLLFFRLKTHSKTGKETIRLTASGGGQTTKEQIEIEVRNPNPAITFAESKWVESGKSCELPYALQGAAAESSIRLEVSRLPSVDLSRRMDFLTFYPHACTEQLTSKAIPLLYLAQFKTLTETENKAVQSGVQDAIKELYARQLPNGGFVYWPGNSVANEWISSYARHVPQPRTRERICSQRPCTGALEAFSTHGGTKLEARCSRSGCRLLAIGLATGLPSLYTFLWQVLPNSGR